MKAFVLAVFCMGYARLSDARAQSQTLPPGFPNFQGGNFPGSFPGGFPGGPQAGVPGFPGGFGGNNEGLEQLKRQCLVNGGPGAVTEIEKAANNMQQCVVNVMPGIQSIPDHSPGGICKFMHNTLHSCLGDFTSKMERCVDKTSAYAPGLSMEMFDSIFKYMCKDDAKHIMTLMTSLAQPTPCLQNLQIAAKSCLSETKHFKGDTSVTTPAFGTNITKPELCSDTKILKDCIIRKAKDYCSGDLYEFISGVSNAMYEPCSACKIFITNTFILLGLLFLTKLF